MPFIGSLGPTELIIILVIALLVLGPGKLPEVGTALGKSIREFRKAATDVKEAASLDPIVPKPMAAAAPTTAAAPTAAAATAAAPMVLDTPAPTPESPSAPGPEAPAS